MADAEVGDLILRRTDGTIGTVTYIGSNFVKVDMPATGGGVYRSISVKEYDIVQACECCGATGYIEKKSASE